MVADGPADADRAAAVATRAPAVYAGPMSPFERARARVRELGAHLARHPARALALAIAVRVGIDLLRLLSRPGNYVDWEESYNATVGFVVWRAGLWTELLRLQYVEFCGGCTVVGALAAPVLGLGGDHFLLWKGIALAWAAATLVAGFFAADRWAGRAAAWALVAMLALPPAGLAEISLFLWGNHQETLLFLFAGLALALDRPVAAALVGGLAISFCRTALYAEAVLIPALIAMNPRRSPAILAAFALGLAPIALPTADGADLGYRMGLADNLLPGGIGYALRRASWLATPPVAGPALGPIGRAVAGVVLVAAGLGGTALVAMDRARGPRRWALVALPIAFAGSWAVSGFEIGESHSLINVRYYAPWMGLMLFGAATGAGPWLSAGGGRGRAAAALVAGPLVVAVAGFADLGLRLDREALTRGAVDLPAFVSLVGRRFDPIRARAATSSDPRVERALRRVEGHRPAIEVCKQGEPRDAVLASLRDRGDEVRIGFGQSLAGCERDEDITPAWLRATNEWLQTLPPAEARSVGLGLSRRLVGSLATPPGTPGRGEDFGRARPTVDAAVRALRDGLPDDAPCWLCGAAGLAAAWSCAEQPPKRVTACLTAAIPGREQVAVATGVGWLLDRIPRRPPDLEDQLARSLPPDAAAALAQGRSDPLDPLLRPDLVRPPETRGLGVPKASIPQGRR